MNFYTNKNKQISIQEIILNHLKKILEISTREFKADCKREVYQNNQVVSIIQEDNRIVYIQAIENFCYSLLPYFDEEAKKDFDELVGVISMPFFEYSKVYEKQIKEYIKKMTGLDGEPTTDQIEKIMIVHQLRNARILFKKMNMLLKRKNYLKGKGYIEGEDETNDGIVDIDKDVEENE